MAAEFVIIGPSKVGKTATVASLSQAAGQLGLSRRIFGDVLSVIPQNDDTQELFTKVINLVLDGYLPFQGTRDIISYVISVTCQTKSSSFWGKLFGMKDKRQAVVSFPDAPGGALFPGDDEEVDHVVMKQYQNELVQKLQTATGLIVCIDASVLVDNATEKEKNEQHKVAISFAKWLPSLCNKATRNKSNNQLPLKNICFVLTKADLWAKKHNLGTMSETTVQNRDAYDHAKAILGQIFFYDIKKYFLESIEVGFCFSSVYGFHNGEPSPFFENTSAERAISRIDDWKPYNIIEPFLFLSGVDMGQKHIQILNWDDLGR